MRGWKALATACLLAISADAGLAHESQISLFAEKDWARLQLVLGRVTVANIRSSQARTATRGEAEDEFYERLVLSPDTVTPSVRYERRTPDATLQAEMVDGTRFTFRHVPINPSSPTVQFTQAPGGGVRCVVESNNTSKTYRAPSLWHFAFEEPTISKQHIFPVLEWLQPQWRFAEFAARTEDELLLEAKSNLFATARLARKLVRQLDSRDYGARQHASLELRRLGAAVLPYLRRIDRVDLTREQRHRVDRLTDELRGNDADTPARVASWLVEDERTWLAMLDHRELPVRQIAAAHLGKRFPKAFSTGEGSTTSDQSQRIAAIRAKYQLR